MMRSFAANGLPSSPDELPSLIPRTPAFYEVSIHHIFIERWALRVERWAFSQIK